MGIRLAMKKELMGLDNSDMLTADDVRAHLANSVKTQKEQDERGFSVISKFNDTHSRLISGDPLKKSKLEFERHRLFNEVLYTRQSVDAWLDSQTNYTNVQ
ncbi:MULTISPECIES: hypothetical protein [Pseudoalteromonas]|jgi:hypothetical protein|uniref:Uncharacterized protein n=2 Tax=Pseudoalteromonas agarivorans TaxID=176102 RepID=A0AAD0TVB5_9GAMM|nr:MULTISPECIES: hypothetical protein [Pseudoalteromonas]MAJ41059.1 hypothetical protein [Pseudoalteromonadaceae bacterium]MCP4058762.1 hypothetical protein [Pseudoalteromonas sp.]MDY6886383.1 hypothetical protein [Pseudomonadota bacterium]OUX84692.1 MAG: hypothetical protein CBC03_13965 [Pseudoalteromonas sp. TMED43]ATC80800.1 hypothetical protein PAGA_a0202 [Pseudoalteromonas agarivorans DSM 14585]|tara:strand:- start:137 stop:439 length:303 start_codon:yes stop_codon:yes gene_type:complete